MAKYLYFTPARKKIDTVHIWTDTGATSATIHTNTHADGTTSLIIEAGSIDQGAAALMDFLKERDAMKREPLQEARP